MEYKRYLASLGLTEHYEVDSDREISSWVRGLPQHQHQIRSRGREDSSMHTTTSSRAPNADAEQQETEVSQASTRLNQSGAVPYIHRPGMSQCDFMAENYKRAQGSTATLCKWALATGSWDNYNSLSVAVAQYRKKKGLLAPVFIRTGAVRKTPSTEAVDPRQLPESSEHEAPTNAILDGGADPTRLLAEGISLGTVDDAAPPIVLIERKLSEILPGVGQLERELSALIRFAASSNVAEQAPSQRLAAVVEENQGLRRVNRKLSEENSLLRGRLEELRKVEELLAALDSVRRK
jgi:hypothetical protein